VSVWGDVGLGLVSSRSRRTKYSIRVVGEELAPARWRTGAGERLVWAASPGIGRCTCSANPRHRPRSCRCRWHRSRTTSCTTALDPVARFSSIAARAGRRIRVVVGDHPRTAPPGASRSGHTGRIAAKPNGRPPNKWSCGHPVGRPCHSVGVAAWPPHRTPEPVGFVVVRPDPGWRSSRRRFVVRESR